MTAGDDGVASSRRPGVRRIEDALATSRRRVRLVVKRSRRRNRLWHSTTAVNGVLTTGLATLDPEPLAFEVQMLLESEYLPEWQRAEQLWRVVDRVPLSGLRLRQRPTPSEVAADIVCGLSDGVSGDQPIEPFKLLTWSVTTKQPWNQGGAEVTRYVHDDQVVAHLRHLIRRFRDFDQRVRDQHVWVPTHPKYRDLSMVMEPYADRPTVDTAVWRLQTEDIERWLGPGLSPQELDALLGCLHGARKPDDLVYLLKGKYPKLSPGAAKDLLYRLKERVRPHLTP